MTGKHWLIILIIIGVGYGIYNGINDLSKSKTNKEQWTNEDYGILVKKCIQDAGENGEKYPRLTKTYCECTITRIKSVFGRQEYLDISKKSNEEQMRQLLPVFQDCVDEYREKISQRNQ